MTRILITGAHGFLGKNLCLHLSERTDLEIFIYTKENSPKQLLQILENIDIIFHLAGVNRPRDVSEFQEGNADLTNLLADAIARIAKESGRVVPVVYTSSKQAELSNPYGKSKRDAELALFNLVELYSVPVYIFRLPNVFGKWGRPNYNSVVATFCHNIAHDLPIQIDSEDVQLTLNYVDDVMTKFIEIIDKKWPAPCIGEFVSVSPQYQITIGALAEQLLRFRRSRLNLTIDSVGQGFTRALYATFVSYLPPDAFAYTLPTHADSRGIFVEMLKTLDAGQFSFFTAHAGVTRGGHYHHSKTEKFLVIRGSACFRFRHMETGQTHELLTSGDLPQVVETVPGWTHDITNVGLDEMVVMLWANEAFDPQRPDTFCAPILIGRDGSQK
jgi:UDP-2-acetamido-2,6-beta-L-arabino-hexul-4-ose reductase